MLEAACEEFGVRVSVYRGSSQTLAFHTCAGSSVTPVPYLCAVGAFVCQRLCSNGRLSRRMHCKVEGMERGMELKGLRVYSKKTKLMVSGSGLDFLRTLVRSHVLSI